MNRLLSIFWQKELMAGIQIVNGFRCSNCTDVAYARRHVDPAHPKDGPYGVYARPDPARTAPAAIYGGALKEPYATPPGDGSERAAKARPRGPLVSLTI